MTKQERDGPFNPELEQHQELKETIIQKLEDNDKQLSTPTLAEKIVEETQWKKKYIRHYLLPDTLDYLEEQNIIEVAKENSTGGIPTKYYQINKI